MDLPGLPRMLQVWRHWPEVVAITIAVSAVPMLAGWVGPNSFYGFRTPSTMASPEEWYRANRLMGCYMIGSQIVALGTMSAVAAAMISWSGGDRVMWGVLWSCLTALLGIAAGAIHYNR